MKKKLSKLAATALSVLMCTSLLAGCSKNNDTPTDDTPANGESSVTQADNSANANSVSGAAFTQAFFPHPKRAFTTQGPTWAARTTALPKQESGRP